MDLIAWGKKIVSFGKFSGISYTELATNHASYVLWAKKQIKPSGGLSDFVSYLDAIDPKKTQITSSESCSHFLSIQSTDKLTSCLNKGICGTDETTQHQRISSPISPQYNSRNENRSPVLYTPTLTRKFFDSYSFNSSGSIDTLTQPSSNLLPNLSPTSEEASSCIGDPGNKIPIEEVVFRICSSSHFTILVKGQRGKLTTYLPPELFHIIRNFQDTTGLDTSRKGPHNGVVFHSKVYPEIQSCLLRHEFKIGKIEYIPNFVLLAFEEFRIHLTKAQLINRKAANILTQTNSPRTASKTSQLHDLLGTMLLNTLKPFQLEGIMFGLSRNGRCLIGDDMGLGKTLQALGIAAVFYDEWPCLIISPSSIRFQWRDQAIHWLSHLITPHEITIIRSGKDIIDLKTTKIIIISYDLIKNEKFRLHYNVIICDESHYLKNTLSQRAAVILPLLQNARRAILLSGTPALNKPTELYNQLTALIPKFTNSKDFATRYAETKLNPWSQRTEYTGCRLSEELYIFLNHTVMVRRLKKDVQSQLPPKTRSKIPVECSQKELNEIKKLMEEHSITSDSNSIFPVFQQDPINSQNTTHSIENDIGSERKSGIIGALFLLSGKAKVKAVIEHINYLLSYGCKFLVFAHHQDVLDSLEKHVQTTHVHYIRIDGKVKERHREERIKLFQENNDYKVALLSLTACSHGLNLTAAGTVVFAELYWVPGVVIQAEDRCHRIGTQYSTVDIHYMIAESTVDELMWRVLQKKWGLITSTLNGEQENYEMTKKSSRPIVNTMQHNSPFNKRSSSIEDIDSPLFTQPSYSKDTQQMIPHSVPASIQATLQHECKIKTSIQKEHVIPVKPLSSHSNQLSIQLCKDKHYETSRQQHTGVELKTRNNDAFSSKKRSRLNSTTDYLHCQVKEKLSISELRKKWNEDAKNDKET